MKHVENGLFITFEGPEGAGKTTQITLLHERLEAEGYQVLQTREPGGTSLGEDLRSLLMTPRQETIVPEAELLMFSASRIQHVKQVILPFLERGGIVLCDRFTDSTVAYQGYARKLSMKLIQDMNRIAVCGRFPDLTIVLDLDVKVGMSRVHRRSGGNEDRIESEALSFHQAVRDGFLDIARKEPRRVKVLDADRPSELIAADLWWEVHHVLG